MIFLVLLLVGLFMLIKPQYVWMLTQQRKSRDATEPSTIYLMSTRFGMGMLAAIGILGLVFAR